MGEAKRRGTFEERKAQAVARDKQRFTELHAKVAKETPRVAVVGTERDALLRRRPAMGGLHAAMIIAAALGVNRK